VWSRFGRVLISVTDLPSAARTYRSLLGLSSTHADVGTAPTRVVESATRAAGPPEVGASAGDGRIVFPLQRGAIELDGFDAGREGLFGLVLPCADLDGTARELESRRLLDGASMDPPRAVPGAALGRVALDRAATFGVPLYVCEDSGCEESGCEEPGSEVAEVESDPASVHAIDHVVIRSGHPERAIELYRDRLGLRLALDRSFPERGVRLLFFRLGGVTLEVASRLGTPSDDAADSLWGVAYHVADPAAARARIAQAGFEVSGVRAGNKPGTAVCTVRGPTHGVPTLLIGPASS